MQPVIYRRDEWREDHASCSTRCDLRGCEERPDPARTLEHRQDRAFPHQLMAALAQRRPIMQLRRVITMVEPQLVIGEQWTAPFSSLCVYEQGVPAQPADRASFRQVLMHCRAALASWGLALI
ncbi:hypothetical protein RoseRS_2178 [Roseiflexus sp. RS-1]|nr:hypothetical protein RoseRS_2178 [Roseiflexus sp. RS-1]